MLSIRDTQPIFIVIQSLLCAFDLLPVNHGKDNGFLLTQRSPNKDLGCIHTYKKAIAA
jgi:hypothetical protein